MPAIDYYFTLISPFTYLGHQAFIDVAAKHGASITYKPVNLGEVHATSGALPIPQRPPSRQAYRLIELQRIADIRDLPITLHPAHFPTNPGLANGCVAAIEAQGGNPADLMLAICQACWVNNQDVADEALMASLLAAHGFDAEAVMAQASSQAITDTMASNTSDAIAAGVVGAPAYVLAGEPFWGQDRIDYLDHALTSARQPFTP